MAELALRDAGPTYYGMPMLKQPTWGWEIAGYFYLGGLSAGAFLLSRIALRLGGRSARPLWRTGTLVAAAAFSPCPALLIKDLGDPKRFHYMLRILKLRSPMSVGSWVLSGYGAVLGLATLLSLRRRPGLLGAVVEPMIDLCGVPLALLMSSYTGVLLSNTSTPLWTRNRWLGALFATSAVHSGATAIQLVRRVQGARPSRPLERMARVGRLAEAGALAAYLAGAGGLARPLLSGPYGRLLLGGGVGAGLVLPALLDHTPGPRGVRRWARALSAAVDLLGGLALRWALVYAGRPSARDPHAARHASRPAP